MSLVDLYAAMEESDHELTKEAEELEKLAAEEEAAGRIMARGFMDELNKVAGPEQWAKNWAKKWTDKANQPTEPKKTVKQVVLPKSKPALIGGSQRKTLKNEGVFGM